MLTNIIIFIIIPRLYYPNRIFIFRITFSEFEIQQLIRSILIAIEMTIYYLYFVTRFLKS